MLDLAAAAGGFGEERWTPDLLAKAGEWIRWEGAPAFREGMFVARVSGRSMEPLIPDGSYCLFRLATLSDARSKPMLVRLSGLDPESSRFTVKDVEAEWRCNDAGIEELAVLVLKSRNPAYPVLRVGREPSEPDVHVVAELVEVLGV